MEFLYLQYYEISTFLQPSNAAAFKKSFTIAYLIKGKRDESDKQNKSIHWNISAWGNKCVGNKLGIKGCAQTKHN